MGEQKEEAVVWWQDAFPLPFLGKWENGVCSRGERRRAANFISYSLSCHRKLFSLNFVSSWKKKMESFSLLTRLFLFFFKPGKYSIPDPSLSHPRCQEKKTFFLLSPLDAAKLFMGNSLLGMGKREEESFFIPCSLPSFPLSPNRGHSASDYR